MFENRVLRRILRPKRDVITGERRKLHNKELTILYSPNNIRSIKSRRTTWAWYVASIGNKKCIQGFGEETAAKKKAWKTKA